ncbi:MAG: hydroxylamine reductase, partial [Victivallales bacterium]|nr:hydroxylamine reductase [Victivallales bacterium]
MSSMFCYQCEQTAKGSGCTAMGVCGKTPETATSQDVLFHVAKGVGQLAHAARQAGAATPAADAFVVEALFTTVTNVNFDAANIVALAAKGAVVKTETKQIAVAAGADIAALAGPAAFVPAASVSELASQGTALSLQGRLDALGADVAGLQELITYGLKGMAAYADHAQILGFDDQTVFDFFIETLAWLQASPTDIGELTARALEVGKVNVTVMALLDQANTTTYGHPVPTPVNIAPVKGKAILISGHDLKDLYSLLKQTEGTGINVYTHSEMLPAHGYPGLKKFPHLVGNYGGAWQDQRSEFVAFPGPILMTTNCIQKPKDDYE